MTNLAALYVSRSYDIIKAHGWELKGGVII